MMNEHPIQGGVVKLLVTSYHRNWDTLRQNGLLGWIVTSVLF